MSGCLSEEEKKGKRCKNGDYAIELHRLSLSGGRGRGNEQPSSFEQLD